MKTFRRSLILLLLLTGVFTLATSLHTRVLGWTAGREGDSILKVLLGDSRRMFARHFFVKADASFHSGFYPSVFDQARNVEENEKAMARAQQGIPDEHDEQEHVKEMSGDAPTDWLDRFGRRFRPTEHTHLEAGKVRELLPWLRISAELDPHFIETYTVAAYWLRKDLKKPDEAEQFLREGLAANPDSYEILVELGSLYYDKRKDISQFLREGLSANPDSYEILLELGRLYYANHNDILRSRNIWKLALRRWTERESKLKEPNFGMLDRIVMNLAHLEEREGNNLKAIEWLEIAKVHSPHPDLIQAQINALQAKPAPPPAAH